MYGGRDGGTIFNGIWLLSLPSFTWIQVESGGASRSAHTCHLVGSRTMLTVGGIVDVRERSGGIELCDFGIGGFRDFDLSDLVWAGGFNAATPAYEVPDTLVASIGGK